MVLWRTKLLAAVSHCRAFETRRSSLGMRAPACCNSCVYKQRAREQVGPISAGHHSYRDSLQRYFVMVADLLT